MQVNVVEYINDVGSVCSEEDSYKVGCASKILHLG